jgi:hypothetical protein
MGVVAEFVRNINQFSLESMTLTPRDGILHKSTRINISSLNWEIVKYLPQGLVINAFEYLLNRLLVNTNCVLYNEYKL